MRITSATGKLIRRRRLDAFCIGRPVARADGRWEQIQDDGSQVTVKLRQSPYGLSVRNGDVSGSGGDSGAPMRQLIRKSDNADAKELHSGGMNDRFMPWSCPRPTIRNSLPARAAQYL